MRDWIVGLRKAATERRLGVSDTWLAGVELDAGFGLPNELKDLYREMDGGRFSADVVVYSVRPAKGADGLMESTRSGSPALPSEFTWRFGQQGQKADLFACPKKVLVRHWAGQPVPNWMEGLGPEAWVFGVLGEEATSLFPSLEQLLAALVPPVATETFGENTFHRALSAVEGAVEVLQKSKPPTARKRKPAARKAKR